MIEWLQTFSGTRTSNSGLNMEKSELENLRREMKRHMKKYDEDTEMILKTESDNDDDEEQDKIDEIISLNQKRNQNNARSSVSAEVYGKFYKKEDFTSKIIPKSEEQKNRITKIVLKSFIFNNLDENELNTVLDAMAETKFKAGENVITQGATGDVLYVVETGELDCSKIFKKGDSPTWLRKYIPGESFGELALLYNAPRAATIDAKIDSICWSLDRETFNHIVKNVAVKKRERYECFLKSIEMLQQIEPYELMQICDALKVKTVEPGTKIILENEEGDNFYIIEEGEAFAEKSPGQGQTPKVVKEYCSGGYFGELALLKNEPRAASVVAKTKCRLLSLDRLSFKRLLGPIENILKRNSYSYMKFVGT